MKKYVLVTVKIILPVAIITWLLLNLEQQHVDQLYERPKNWGLLIAAFVFSLTAISITFIRWYLLVRTLDLPFRLRDAFRLGFLGYLLNFISPGSVGGDVFKAFFIAREQPGRRTEAVATVVVDRLIGLYALLLVTSATILLSDVSRTSPQAKIMCNLTLLATALGGLAVAMVLVPGFTNGRLSRWLSRLPKIGVTLERLIIAVRMYRGRRGVLAWIIGMSMSVHCLLAIAIYLAACALYDKVPTLTEHFVIVPLSFVFAAVPITPNGFGTFEFALEKLYASVPAAPISASGTIVALTFEVIRIALAVVGVAYYWTSRREVREVLQQAQSEDAFRDYQLHEQASLPQGAQKAAK